MEKASRKKKRLANVVANIENRNLESLTTPIKVGLLYKPIVHILLILTLGFLAYSNTFNVPFHFDDGAVIVENPIIKNLRFFIEPSEAKVYSEHFQYPTFSMRYIGYLAFALNYKVHGLDVTGYHFVNLFIHIINGLLVYLLIVLTFRTPFLHMSPLKNYSRLVAIFAALLFVCHPIQTQAVTYIWQRVTSLAAMFYLLSLAMYIKVRLGQNTEDRRQNTDNKTSCHSCESRNPETKDWIPVFTGMTDMSGKGLHKIFSLSPVLWYLGSVLSAILAMKTKEISFTLPIVITLYEFMFFKGKIKRRILSLIPLLLTILIIPLSLIGTDKPIGDVIGDVSEATRVQTTMSRSDYLFTQFRVIVTYIRLLFFPINQNLDYDYPIYNSFFNPEVFLSLLFLLSLFGFAIYLLYRSRSTVHSSQPSDLKLATCNLQLISFGILWFFITLSVESSIIPISDVIFEHRVYLPSVGAAIAFSIAVFYVLQFVVHRSRIFTSYFPLLTSYFLLLSTIVVTLSITTYQRNIVWQDGVSLWKDVVKKSPEKARPHNELGLAYMDKGKHLDAILCFQKALEINPNLYLAYSNIGNAFAELGYTDYAIIAYQKAIEINPKFETAHYNLGIVYYQKKMFDEAVREFNIAISLNPFNHDAKKNLELLFGTQ